MAPTSSENWNFFPLSIGYSYTSLWVKNSLEIPLSLMVFEIFTIFHFPLKSKMASKSGKNWNFSLDTGYSCTTLWVKNSLEIPLSLTVSEIFSMFYFTAKIQDGRQKWWKLKFFPFVQDTPVLTCGSKIHSKSLSYGFRDICDFSDFHKSSNKVAITHLYIEQQVWNLNMLQFTKKQMNNIFERNSVAAILLKI